MRRAGILVGSVWLMCSAALGQPLDKSCLTADCKPGDKATTYATKREPFYACPTRELATYTNSVLGLVVMQITLSGQPPNISDKTGEPEYKDGPDGPNMTRLLLDDLRHKAGVDTFDQAVSMCSEGIAKIRVTILNVDKDDEVIWVRDDKRNTTFWVPNSALDKH